MKLVVIDGPNGIRKVGEGEPFRLATGERVVGAEDTGDQGVIRANTKAWMLDKLASYFGIAAADLIFFAAKAFNIPHCSTCEMRYKILQSIEKIGLFKSIKLIGKTIVGYELSDEDTRLVEQSFQEVKSSS